MNYHKYGAEAKTIDNIRFASKREAERYSQLKLMQKVGIIKDLVCQPKYDLIPTFKKNGQVYNGIKYVADFAYYDIEAGKTVVEDVKGFETKDFKIKRKLFEYFYKDLNLTMFK